MVQSGGIYEAIVVSQLHFPELPISGPSDGDTETVAEEQHW